MMQLVFDILTISFVLFGTFFMLVGAVGIVRCALGAIFEPILSSCSPFLLFF